MPNNPSTPKRRQRGDSDTGMVILVCFLLAFLFEGDPDLWDKLHAALMRWAEQAWRTP